MSDPTNRGRAGSDGSRDGSEDPTDTAGRADAPEDLGVEAPEADAAEQRADLAPERDDPRLGADPASADEGDRAEQARVVELNEDEYR
ncbi:hypothetical protein ACSMX9_20390 [Streptomyces sp. LE64]|jgi:hypothetical protein|uniref:hypothetical protein n=1 Tax=unclassified Streptomyces TaxID=2593676 RepID=UPI00332B9ACF